MKVSTCCQHLEHKYYTGICSYCKEHAEFEEESKEFMTTQNTNNTEYAPNILETKTLWGYDDEGTIKAELYVLCCGRHKGQHAIRIYCTDDIKGVMTKITIYPSEQQAKAIYKELI